MQDSSTDFYAVLGVAQDASPEALRSAYRRIVKAHPPESGSEIFRLAAEAYRVLCNPERRRAYDAAERLPPAVDLRLRQIMGRLQSQDPGAEDELRALCREHFELRAPRFALGVLLDRTARHDEAADVFDLLFAECPDNATYARWLGDTLIKSGDEANGVAHLKQAIILDEDDHEAYTCLVHCHLQAGRTKEALGVLDRGIRADGSVDVRDVHLLIQRLLVLAQMGDGDAMRETADWIVTAIPAEDDEAGRWMAGRLQGLCRTLQDAGRTHLVPILLETVCRLDPASEPPAAAPPPGSPTPSALDAHAALLRDPEVAPWIKTCLRVAELDPESESARGWRDVVAARLGREGAVVEAEWAAAQRRHASVLAELRGLWPEPTRPSPQAAPAPPRASPAAPKTTPRPAPTRSRPRSARRGRRRR